MEHLGIKGRGSTSRLVFSPSVPVLRWTEKIVVASPGAVLVILGCVAFVVLTVM